MKRKRLIAAFLSLMLVVTVVMPAANALGTGTIELGPNEGTSATETPVEEPAEPETPVEEPTDPGASDEQTPTDPDDTDTSDEGTEQTPTDPDDTDTSDEETATDPDDTDTSDEETPDTPAEEPTEPETPVEEPTEPDTPAEEPTDPEEPPVVEEPTEPETPTEEPTVPETPEQLPAEEIQEIPVEPLAAGDLTITLVDENGERLGTATISQQNYQDGWTSVSEVAGAINNPPQGYTFSRAYTLTYLGYREDGVNYIHYQSGGHYGRGWRYSDSNDWWENGSSLDNLYFVYTPATGQGETGYFYLRLDGVIPAEPGQFGSELYSTGIEVENAVINPEYTFDNSTRYEIEGNHYKNSVVDQLNAVPSDERIQLAIDRYNATKDSDEPEFTYDPKTQVILWYVQKQSSGAAEFINTAGRPQTINDGSMLWHIDGVILNREQVSISYDANLPSGAQAGSDFQMPGGYQASAGTVVQVGANREPNGQIITPSIEGYTFRGWALNDPNSQDIYQPDSDYTLNENTIFYALWVPEDNYVLQLKKVDALGEPVAGAEFTIQPENSQAINATIPASGTYVNDSISPGIEYRITETSAPAGYRPLESSFSFELITNGQGALELDENIPEVLRDAIVCEFDSESHTVTITVTNIGYFYIFHTADIESGPYVEEIPIDEEHVSGGTFDIVNHTEEGYLYGGYYRDYALKGDYQIDNPAESDSVANAMPYAGDQTSWDSRDAYTDEIGTAMTPEAGKTYFLKEVPNTYLHPATYVVYDTHDGNQIVDLYLLTATDDANYSSVGFDVTGAAVTNSPEDVSGTLYAQVEVERNGTHYETLKAFDKFGVSGYLALSETKDSYIKANQNYTQIPYFVTLDGVKVTGNQKLKVYLRDTTYNGWKLPGITKIAQSKEIVNGAD